MANVSSSNGLEKRPKLRFPGFDEPWDNRKFSSIFSFLQNNTLSRSELDTYGKVLNIHYGDVLIKYGSVLDASDQTIPYIVPGNESPNYVHLQDGDVVIADTAEDETVGKTTEIYNVLGSKIEAGLHTIPCRPMIPFAPKYLGYYMNTSCYHKQLIPLMQGIKVLSVSKGNISKTEISAPNTLEEQKKISSLLYLLDQRAAIQSKIIEALKKYKRGVLFRIFGNNENASLRYSSWSKRTLAELCCEFKSGRNISASLIHSSGLFPVYGGNGIRGYCDQYSHEGEYVVVGRQGALCGNVRLIQGMNYLSEHAIAVKANEQNDTRFLLYLLDYMRLGQYSDQGAQPGLAVNKLLRLQCDVPDKNTQTHIAAFLFCIDKQIGSHQKLLDSMLKQRKALLQQLFI